MTPTQTILAALPEPTRTATRNAIIFASIRAQERGSRVLVEHEAEAVAAHPDCDLDALHALLKLWDQS